MIALFVIMILCLVLSFLSKNRLIVDLSIFVGTIVGFVVLCMISQNTH